MKDVACCRGLNEFGSVLNTETNAKGGGPAVAEAFGANCPLRADGDLEDRKCTRLSSGVFFRRV